MERRIEDRNLRRARQRVHSRADAGQIRRIVQRREMGRFFD
jgi:hypothetical protein